MNNKACFMVLGVVAAVSLSAQPAAAQSQTGTIAVSATVTNNCTIDSSPLAFGDVNTLSGQPVDGAGSISVTCTSQTPWAVSADVGQGASATFAERKMINGANELSYSLFTDSARTTVWGDGVDGVTGTLAGTGSGLTQVTNFYGRIAAGQTAAPSGTYADTVTVTVTY